MRMNLHASCAITAVGLVLCGCAAAPGPRTVDNPDPLVKIPAIKRAVENKDLDAAGQLVKDLESDDPALRFYAIEGLRRLNGGDDMGYEFYSDDPDDEARKGAVKRWQDWLARQEEGRR